MKMSKHQNCVALILIESSIFVDNFTNKAGKLLKVRLVFIKFQLSQS